MRKRVQRIFLCTLGCLGVAVGCNTGAVGVRECREIELLRCEMSARCGVIEEDEVEACQRTYRDQCLHGIAGPEVPTADEQDKCVELIQRAGDCAEKDEEQPAEICFADVIATGGMGGAPALPDVPDDAPTVCDVVASPWDYPACDFLNYVEGGGGEEG